MTGRILAHYNNSTQTKRFGKLDTKYDEDVLSALIEDEGKFGDRMMLKSPYGKSESPKVVYTPKVKPRTLFCAFHHAKSRINALFGDECDELIMTARFKSVKVDVIPVGDEVACS